MENKVLIKIATCCITSSKEDVDEILNILISKNCDIIAIQNIQIETSDKIYRLMKAAGYNYGRFDKSEHRIGVESYEVIFTKLNTQVKRYKIFSQTQQKRGMTIYKMFPFPKGLDEKIDPTSIWVCTSCFEKGPNHGIRRSQVEEVRCEFLRTDDCVVFAGDTNIPNWQRNLDLPPEEWYDAWREKGTEENKNTEFDDRMDRILYKNVECVDFELIKLFQTEDRTHARHAISATFSISSRIQRPLEIEEKMEEENNC